MGYVVGAWGDAGVESLKNGRATPGPYCVERRDMTDDEQAIAEGEEQQ